MDNSNFQCSKVIQGIFLITNVLMHDRVALGWVTIVERCLCTSVFRTYDNLNEAVREVAVTVQLFFSICYNWLDILFQVKWLVFWEQCLQSVDSNLWAF